METRKKIKKLVEEFDPNETVLEGYVYPCGHIECRGIILFPRKVTIADFKQALAYWKSDVSEELPRIEEGLKENFLNCGLITPCAKDPKHGLGPDAIELVDYFKRFAGKRVKIVIRELTGDKRDS